MEISQSHRQACPTSFDSLRDSTLTILWEFDEMLAAFTAGLLFITVSELGDKSFFIAAILAMKYARRWVFVGAIAALAVMTILSVGMGKTIALLLPEIYVKWAAILLFVAFGITLLYQAKQMSAHPDNDECSEAEAAVRQVESRLKRRNPLAITTQSFALTFIAEWGDRTQLTTITLSAANNILGVTLGCIIGHAICTGIAVLCGKLVCGRISERTLTTIGGTLFLIFGGVALTEIIH